MDDWAGFGGLFEKFDVLEKKFGCGDESEWEKLEMKESNFWQTKSTVL